MSWFQGKCQKVRDEILEQPKNPQASIEEHLGACPPCRSFHEEQMTVQESLNHWAPPSPSKDFTHKTLMAFATSASESSLDWMEPRTLQFPWLAAVAAGVLFFVGASFLLKEKPKKLTNPSVAKVIDPDSFRMSYREMVDSNRDLSLLGYAVPNRGNSVFSFSTSR